MKKVFDIVFSLIFIVLLLPFLILIAIIIKFDSKGGVFYLQMRVGKDNKDFNLYKFRTMKINSDKYGLLTVGAKDNRITRFGYFLRKYKLDELPQLINIIFGNMSVVGPRPEVRKYVNRYNQEQLRVLQMKPGLTDFASIEYINENELLAKSNTPEETYINEIMPHKLNLALKYLEKKNFVTDIKIIFRTFLKIFKK